MCKLNEDDYCTIEHALYRNIKQWELKLDEEKKRYIVDQTAIDECELKIKMNKQTLSKVRKI